MIKRFEGKIVDISRVGNTFSSRPRPFRDMETVEYIDLRFKCLITFNLLTLIRS